MTSNLVLDVVSCFPSAMITISRSRLAAAFAFCFFLQTLAPAASKPHTVIFGKWTIVQWNPESAVSGEDEKPLTMKVRPLLVDARVKEFTFGSPHDVTERLFVVRRAFRVNDSLPQESASHWQWQRGGWLLVDEESAPGI